MFNVKGDIMPHIKITIYTCQTGLFPPHWQAGPYAFQDDVSLWYTFFRQSNYANALAELSASGIPYRVYTTTIRGYSETIYIAISYDSLLDCTIHSDPNIRLSVGLGEVLTDADHETADNFLLFDP